MQGPSPHPNEGPHLPQQRVDVVDAQPRHDVPLEHDAGHELRARHGLLLVQHRGQGCPGKLGGGSTPPIAQSGSPLTGGGAKA